ncbi:MAG TPA: hypothetical protein VF338_10455 [Leptolinea sp.]
MDASENLKIFLKENPELQTDLHPNHKLKKNPRTLPQADLMPI